MSDQSKISGEEMAKVAEVMVNAWLKGSNGLPMTLQLTRLGLGLAEFLEQNFTARFPLFEMDFSMFEEGGDGEQERECKVCGCTEDAACVGGCSWVEMDLCSACVPHGDRLKDTGYQGGPGYG